MTSVPTTGWSSLLLALLVTFGPLPARAATITVNETSDSSGGRGCTLRDAITAANTDTAVGGCTAGSGTDTIVFGLIGSAKIKLLTGSELAISSDITIQGPGASALTIDGNGTTRVLHVTSGKASISDLTIKNGNSGAVDGGGILVDGSATLSATNCVISGNQAGTSGTGVNGGGIENMGTLDLTNCIISGNKVGFTMGPADFFGGGIDNEGTATLTKCTISANQSITGSGGGISNLSGTLTVTDSTITGNKAAGTGGGIEEDGTATLQGSTISGNKAADGGGINKNGSGLNLVNCTISGNTAKGQGGGLQDLNTQPPPGAVLTNCTVSGNKANPMSGGGVYNPFGGVTLANTIIANSAMTGGDCVGPAVDNGNNLIEDSTNHCGLTNGTNGDIVGSNPGLVALAKNGGPTLTMALCTGAGTPKASCTGASPALATGSLTTCGGALVTNHDQRGLLRSACDIGAYESP